MLGNWYVQLSEIRKINDITGSQTGPVFRCPNTANLLDSKQIAHIRSATKFLMKGEKYGYLRKFYLQEPEKYI